MVQGEHGDLVLEVALTRYRQGQCPGCGKGLGEPRGLERRTRPDDLYCHTCKRPWPLQMEAVVLREELASRQPAELVASPQEDRAEPLPSAPAAGGRFDSLLRRLMRRR